MTTTPEQIAEAYFPSSYRDRKQCVKAINAAMAPLEKEIEELKRNTYRDFSYKIKELQDKLQEAINRLDEAEKDKKRWKLYASSPQTALMLGSTLNPNDESVDWIAECNQLADSAMNKEPK
jgi:hypothetical protein